MIKYSTLVNLVCILGLVFLAWAGTGTGSTVTVLPAPEVVKPKVILADGKWGENNEVLLEFCSEYAADEVKTQKLGKYTIPHLINECAFEQGITI